MRIKLFYHSLLSDWNHGNAHFLRGISRELSLRGHDVEVFEPEDAWSLRNLRELEGDAPIEGFRRAYPGLESRRYRLADLDLDEALDGADLVIVHEWNDSVLVRRIAHHRRSERYRLLFHDTHHRSVTAANFIESLRLQDFDGVLVYGASLKERYIERGWSDHIWIWHEAADVTRFHPPREDAEDDETEREGVVWIGNWGDGERTPEIEEYLLRPVSALGIPAVAYGVRYPAEVQRRLASLGVQYGGWLANYRVPEVFARHLLTIHIPRRPYLSVLPGIPTIRVFEALACGIPLVCSPWEDREGLFRPGEDYLVARSASEMASWIRCLISDEDARRDIAASGRRTILERHTCGHRVDELMSVAGELGIESPPDPSIALYDRSENEERRSS